MFPPGLGFRLGPEHGLGLELGQGEGRGLLACTTETSPEGKFKVRVGGYWLREGLVVREVLGSGLRLGLGLGLASLASCPQRRL